jgi:hypothetical protein
MTWGHLPKYLRDAIDDYSFSVATQLHQWPDGIKEELAKERRKSKKVLVKALDQYRTDILAAVGKLR